MIFCGNLVLVGAVTDRAYFIDYSKTARSQTAPTVLYNLYTIQNSCIAKEQGLMFGVMGILLLILGVFIIMGGIQVLGAGLLGLAVIGAFVISSMLVGKVLFKL